jgi:hypothetical protein
MRRRGEIILRSRPDIFESISRAPACILTLRPPDGSDLFHSTLDSFLIRKLVSSCGRAQGEISPTLETFPKLSSMRTGKGRRSD